ncbi:DNA-processing protein DprA [Motiliproteus sp. MSK22-1]|uniref:DNA-processing protein DprA n=1 Tax=Motiliproteus sp. MSK22-1 TaxID=1897630 RepID=UPI000978CE4D|nr:DNA-processing protein DprA [Motiliproteus sp. MSK22-1]OMH39466.1 DNA protecting protein DprA [Motiliproteus sp. MSK22-1]
MHSHLKSWLLLSFLPGLGPSSLNRLRIEFGSATSILDQQSKELAAYGVRQNSLRVLNEWRKCPVEHFLSDKLEQAEAWAELAGHHLISIECPGYPCLLKEIHDPPPVLYLRGDPEVLQQHQVAIVGSRNASISGCENAYGFAKQLSLNGWVPTSGLAIGIDGQAHLGALDGLGLTIAVMATGVDSVYPRRHCSLAERIIAGGGAVLSEFPLGTAPRAQLFPRRNRIISGLSMATLVVEASPNSGSLITAKQALNQGREVFAIPGSIHSPMSKGCHELIRQGAKLVEQVDHIFEELGPQISLPIESCSQTGGETDSLLSSLTPFEKRLVSFTGFEPTSVDQLVQRSGHSAEEVISRMLELELKGLVRSVPGGYQR